MKKGNISKKTILKSIAKMVADKEMVRSYFKGKTPFRTLSKTGIKLAKPLKITNLTQKVSKRAN